MGLIHLHNIQKIFPGGVVANRDADLTLRAGEIHAIVGENGAGKSTLMNILYGLHQPDRGRIEFKGEPVSIDSPRTAKHLGIGMVHQHFMLVPSFTVLENVILGYEPVQKGFYVNLEKAAERVRTLCERYHFEVPLDQPVRALPVGSQQRVEIIKALYRGAEVLILDEPTAVLTPLEVQELFAICREMKRQGKTILFISHKLREVLALSDRVTVMRQGCTLDTLETSHTNETELAQMIIGRNRLWTVKSQHTAEQGEVLLQARNLSVHDAQGHRSVRDLSLALREGEILGVAGVEGNGQSELVAALAGLLPAAAGSILLAEEDITSWSVAKRRAHGVAHIPQDRMGTGLALDATLAENLVIDEGEREPFRHWTGVLDWERIRSFGAQKIVEYNIVAPGPQTETGTLSGGNLQKLVAARELSGDKRCLLVAHPTRGLDIGSAEFIYQQLLAAREAGCGVLLISADLDEILLLSDRLVVMYEGEIVGEYRPGEATPEQLGLLMTGASRMESDV